MYENTDYLHPASPNHLPAPCHLVLVFVVALLRIMTSTVKTAAHPQTCRALKMQSCPRTTYVGQYQEKSIKKCSQNGQTANLAAFFEKCSQKCSRASRQLFHGIEYFKTNQRKSSPKKIILFYGIEYFGNNQQKVLEKCIRSKVFKCIFFLK